jgi:hypothetical protein
MMMIMTTVVVVVVMRRISYKCLEDGGRGFLAKNGGNT